MSCDAELQNAKEELEKIKNHTCGLKFYKNDIFYYLDSEFTLRRRIISYVDVLVDGRYMEELRDVSLHWRGSSNQRVIDVQQSLKKGEIVLWNS